MKRCITSKRKKIQFFELRDYGFFSSLLFFLYVIPNVTIWLERIRTRGWITYNCAQKVSWFWVLDKEKYQRVCGDRGGQRRDPGVKCSGKEWMVFLEYLRVVKDERERWKGGGTTADGQWPEEQRGQETRNMERLFAMVDKRTLDVFHCQHFVSLNFVASPPLPPSYDTNRRTILDRTKFVRKFVSLSPE